MKSWLVWWLNIMSSGGISICPCATASRRSTRKTLRPRVLSVELLVRRGAGEEEHQVGVRRRAR